MKWQGLILAAVTRPLVWVERSRGRKRQAILGLYALIAVSLGLLVYRASRLNGIPDIGDPFDTAEVRALVVPPARNAFSFWREARRKAVPPKLEQSSRLNTPKTWATPSDEAFLAFRRENAESLALWRRGAECSEAQLARAEEQRTTADMDLVFKTYVTFSQMTRMLASEAAARGEMAEAWDGYRLTLRGSRLIGRNGTSFLQSLGMYEYQTSSEFVTRWAEDPKTDAKLLRRALDDLKAIRALSSPRSVVLKIDYVANEPEIANTSRFFDLYCLNLSAGDPEATSSVLNHMPTVQRLVWFVQNEPERTLRLRRLAYANWLAYAGAPRSTRPRPIPLDAQGTELYDAPVAGIEGKGLAEKILASRVATWLLTIATPGTTFFDRDQILQARLEVTIASELFLRERGKLPASPSELVGPYLDRLPDVLAPESSPLR